MLKQLGVLPPDDCKISGELSHTTTSRPSLKHSEQLIGEVGGERLKESGASPEDGVFFIDSTDPAFGHAIELMRDDFERLLASRGAEVVGKEIAPGKMHLDRLFDVVNMLTDSNYDKSELVESLPKVKLDQKEIYKREIYPEHGVDGVGYRIDVATRSDETVSKIVLATYVVTQEPRHRVFEGRTYEVFFSSDGTSRMEVDLSMGELLGSRVHKAQGECPLPLGGAKCGE